MLGYWINIKITNFLKINDEEIDIITKLLSSIILGYGFLIVPMVIIGVTVRNFLDNFVFIYFAFSIFISLFLSGKFLYSFDRTNKIWYKDKNSLYSLLIILLLLGHFFLLLTSPIRGWDALNYYFPNALYYFFQDNIVIGYNPLNLFPLFKPPLNTNNIFILCCPRCIQ